MEDEEDEEDEEDTDGAAGKPIMNRNDISIKSNSRTCGRCPRVNRTISSHWIC